MLGPDCEETFLVAESQFHNVCASASLLYQRDTAVIATMGHAAVNARLNFDRDLVARLVDAKKLAEPDLPALSGFLA